MFFKNFPKYNTWIYNHMKTRISSLAHEMRVYGHRCGTITVPPPLF